MRLGNRLLSGCCHRVGWLWRQLGVAEAVVMETVAAVTVAMTTRGSRRAPRDRSETATNTEAKRLES